MPPIEATIGISTASATMLWILVSNRLMTAEARIVVNRFTSSHEKRGVFFCQAEDGIRALIVTGVQTCALPICRGRQRNPAAPTRARDLPVLSPFPVVD